MQTTPASEVAQDHAEDAHDFFEEIVADGHIDQDEVAAMRRRLDLVVHHADRANLDRAIGVCLIRGGYGGDRHLRLVRQRDALDQLMPGDPLEAA
jgi:hypothetical protein